MIPVQLFEFCGGSLLCHLLEGCILWQVRHGRCDHPVQVLDPCFSRDSSRGHKMQVLLLLACPAQESTHCNAPGATELRLRRRNLRQHE
jgi:hypothetical protein